MRDKDWGPGLSLVTYFSLQALTFHSLLRQPPQLGTECPAHNPGHHLTLKA